MELPNGVSGNGGQVVWKKGDAERERELIRIAEQEATELLERTAQKLPPPDSVPGFRIISEVGRGGMGVVYKAVQLSTHRIVALKVMLAGPFASNCGRERFQREVKNAARFKHPGIVRVLEGADPSAAHPWYAMDLVSGMQLHRWWHATQPDVATTLRLFVELCEAVEYAHRQRVVHRDLKPANVLVDPQGKPHILDFGLSKATDQLDGPPTLTIEASTLGHVLGTLPYLSPEQAAGTSGEIDPRTDVYALGVMLYEAISGSLPFDSTGSPSRVMQRIQEDHPRAPSSLNPQAKRGLDAVILKAMEKKRQLRYQSAAEMGEDLRRCLRGEPPIAQNLSLLGWVRGKTFQHRRKLYVVAASLGVILLLFGAQAWWRNHSQSLHAAQLFAAGRQALLYTDMFVELRAAGALEQAREATSRHLGLPEARLLAAKLEHRLGQTNVGIAALEDAIHYDVAQSSARALLAEIYREQGEDRLADGVTLQASADPPMTAEDWYVRSYGTLDRARALEHLRKALEIDATYLHAWQRMLQLHLADRNPEEALACADTLIALGSVNYRSMMLRGHALMFLGRFDEAIRQYTDMLDLDLENPQAHRFRAIAHRAAGEYEKALADVNKAWDCECRRTGNASSWLLFQRVTPLWILGKLDEAAEMCVRAHERMLTPTYADARHFLILQSLGRTTEGTTLLEKALAVCRDPWLRKIFECLNGELAPVDLVSAADNAEHRCEAYYYAGESCLLRGQISEAVEWFQTCVDTELLFDPNTWPPEPMNEYELARWRLKSLTGGAQSTT